jgi:hypothetical protein
MSSFDLLKQYTNTSQVLLRKLDDIERRYNGREGVIKADIDAIVDLMAEKNLNDPYEAFKQVHGEQVDDVLSTPATNKNLDSHLSEILWQSEQARNGGE